MSLTHGATATLGSHTGWNLQSAPNPAYEKERAVAHNALGNEIASQLYDARLNYTQEMEANITGSITAPDTIGKLYGSGIVTSISLSTGFGRFARCSLVGHNHATNAHTDNLKQVAHGITISGFGPTDPASGTVTASGDYYLNESTINITCEHAESRSSAGETNAGENHNPMLNVTLTYRGKVTAYVASGWDVVSILPNTQNTEFEETVVTLVKPLAFS